MLHTSRVFLNHGAMMPRNVTLQLTVKQLRMASNRLSGGLANIKIHGIQGLTGVVEHTRD